MTFMSTAEMVAQIGARPIFADIDQYYLIDIESVKKKITSKTRAIIVVDLYGQCVNFHEWQQFRQQGIKLIQDAAQSWGIRYKDQNPHSWVDAQCWSFYPGKNLSAIGDAGGVSGSEELVDRVRQLSNHGRSKKYVHTHLGWNQRMDAVQAAVLSVKMDRQEWILTNKRQVAQAYKKFLSDTVIILPQVAPWTSHTWNQFVVCVENRNTIFDLLTRGGIECGKQYPIPLHRQEAFGYLPPSRLPYTDDLAGHNICLPMHAYLTHKQVQRTCETLLWHLDDGK
jgi:UDP-2-acetamido-2-deoxy-ribo-hexuluronate aminotransferase